MKANFHGESPAIRSENLLSPAFCEFLRDYTIGIHESKFHGESEAIRSENLLSPVFCEFLRDYTIGIDESKFSRRIAGDSE